jgi:uncharacterized membrane protein YoaK (UPF0700 family)
MSMLKRSIAVAAGYVLWTVLWLGYGAALRMMAILPADDTTAVDGAIPLLAMLIGSVVASLLAGYTTATLDRTTSMVPVLVLGVLLLATGIFVEIQYWQLMPVWYHLLFLALLVPACFAGSRLRSGRT